MTSEPIFYTYILLCSNGVFYTGHTANIEKRLEEHKNGWGAQLTRSVKDFQLVWHEQHASRELAIRRELQIKGWTRRKKWALINEDLELLKRL